MYAKAFRRGWWIVLGILALTLATAAIVTSRVTPIYRSTTLVVVTPNSEVRDTGEILKSLETLERRTVIATFARIPATSESRAEAAALLKLDPRAARAYRVDGSVLPTTNIISISVEGPDASLAAGLANALAEIAGRNARSMYRIYTIRVLEPATLPGRPARPDVRRNYLVALTIGLIVGLVAAFAMEQLRQPAAEG